MHGAGISEHPSPLEAGLPAMLSGGPVRRAVWRMRLPPIPLKKQRDSKNEKDGGQAGADTPDKRHRAAQGESTFLPGAPSQTEIHSERSPRLLCKQSSLVRVVLGQTPLGTIDHSRSLL
jgi:hypothetical protein